MPRQGAAGSAREALGKVLNPALKLKAAPYLHFLPTPVIASTAGLLADRLHGHKEARLSEDVENSLNLEKCEQIAIVMYIRSRPPEG